VVVQIAGMAGKGNVYEISDIHGGEVLNNIKF
jgi:hypothetical protein